MKLTTLADTSDEDTNKLVEFLSNPKSLYMLLLITIMDGCDVLPVTEYIIFPSCDEKTRLYTQLFGELVFNSVLMVDKKLFIL
jgi:hypothetical protein